MKHLFVAIGFVVVAVIGWELCRDYSEMKREREARRQPGAPQPEGYS